MSKNIEDEIQAALHAQPTTGSLDPRLDFFIKSAESFIEEAKAEIERKQPEGPYDSHKAVAKEAMQMVIQRAFWQVNGQLQAVDQSLTLTAELGERLFKSNNSRPANISEAQLDRKWQSLKGLFDSLNGAAVTLRIKQLLEEACKPYGGDDLNKFILRDGDGLVRAYLESRRQLPGPYYEAVRDTAQAYETDLTEGCNTILMARRLKSAWPTIRLRLSNQLSDLSSLASKQALSWDQPAAGLSIQSASDGSINAKFASLEEFRQFCRKHGQGF